MAIIIVFKDFIETLFFVYCAAKATAPILVAIWLSNCTIVSWVLVAVFGVTSTAFFMSAQFATRGLTVPFSDLADKNPACRSIASSTSTAVCVDV